MDVIYNSIMWLMPSAFAMSMILALQPFIIHLYDITSVIYFMASKPDPIYIDLTQSSPEPDNAPAGGSAPEPENNTGESSSAVEKEDTEDAGPSKLDKGKGKAESGEATPYDEFNNLIEQRTALRSLWEYHNRNWNHGGAAYDQRMAEEAGAELDQVEETIENIKNREGFLDPEDMPEDPDDSE